MTRDESPPDAKALTGNPGPYDTDDAWLVGNFLGKTRSDFAAMLRSRTGFSTEDFMWMAEPGLRYYLPEVEIYLTRPGSADDWDFVHGLTCSLSFRFDELDTEVKAQVRRIATLVDEHRATYGINAEDSDFNRHLRTLLP